LEASGTWNWKSEPFRKAVLEDQQAEYDSKNAEYLRLILV